jgi:outer membrane protein TolC
LTGLDELPARIEEPVALAALMPATHPRQRLAEAAAERARAGMQVARESRRDAPELSVGVQQSRDDFASASRNSLRIGLNIPFATEGRNAPRIAAANSALIRAEAASRQVIAELDGGQRKALAALDNAELAAAAAQERSALAAERLQLMQRAFDLGELSLVELMRVRSAANAARLESTQARIALSAAKANMNQAKGILP